MSISTDPNAGNTLQPTSGTSLAGVSKNVNSKDFVGEYNRAYTGRSVLAPAGVQQIGAFAFDYHGDDAVLMDNDITDHWLEDNVAAQDHIGVRPTIVTLKGFVSELSVSSSLLSKISTALNAASTTLTRVNAYTGHYTPGAVDAMNRAITQAQSIAVQIEQAVARAAQLASFFQIGPAMTKQQAAYFQLSSLRIARTIFTVYTPFQVFDNMAIVSLKAIQTDKSKMVTDFSVTLKQLNFVGGVATPNYTDYGGRAAQAKQFKVPNGATAGTAIVNGVQKAIVGSFAPLL